MVRIPVRKAEDELVSLREVTKRTDLVPKRRRGSRVNYATLWRWAAVGSAGARLHVVYVGSTPYTSARWLREFFDAVAAARLGRLQPQSDDAVTTAAERRLHQVGAM